MVYSGAGKVAPAPLSGTMGREVVVVVVGVDVVVGLVVVLVVEGVVDEEVVDLVVEVVVVEVFVVEEVVDVEVVVGLVVVVVEGVVVLLQALNARDATSNNDVTTTSHFVLNLLNNLHFSFLLFTFIIKAYL